MWTPYNGNQRPLSNIWLLRDCEILIFVCFCRMLWGQIDLLQHILDSPRLWKKSEKSSQKEPFSQVSSFFQYFFCSIFPSHFLLKTLENRHKFSEDLSFISIFFLWLMKVWCIWWIMRKLMKVFWSWWKPKV